MIAFSLYTHNQLSNIECWLQFISLHIFVMIRILYVVVMSPTMCIFII